MISPELNMSDYGDEDPADRLERLGLPLLLLNRALIEATFWNTLLWMRRVLREWRRILESADVLVNISVVKNIRPTVEWLTIIRFYSFRIGLMMSSLSSLGGILRLVIGAQCHLRHALKVL